MSPQNMCIFKKQNSATYVSFVVKYIMNIIIYFLSCSVYICVHKQENIWKKITALAIFKELWRRIELVQVSRSLDLLEC